MEQGQVHLIAKLAQVMGSFDHVEKRGKNNFQNYSYVKASDVAHAVRSGLAQQGVFLTAEIIEKRYYTVPAKEGSMQAVDLHIRYTFRDGESGETVTSDGFGSGTDKGDKAAYKALTGALKYALRTAFLIPDESDPEADESTDRAVSGKSTIPEPQAKSAPAKETGRHQAEVTEIKGMITHIGNEEPIKGKGKNYIPVTIGSQIPLLVDDEYARLLHPLQQAMNTEVIATCVRAGKALWLQSIRPAEGNHASGN